MKKMNNHNGIMLNPDFTLSWLRNIFLDSNTVNVVYEQRLTKSISNYTMLQTDGVSAKLSTIRSRALGVAL